MVTLRKKKPLAYLMTAASFCLCMFLVVPSVSVERTFIAPAVPNELGTVMVLMYHDIRAPEAEWSRTPENFTRDLEILYEQNFRPIRLTDFVDGHINLEKGMSPVVITFDDATLGQFKIVEADGRRRPDSRSAVGILEAFHEKHPDFSMAATFFVNGKIPFKEADSAAFKLNYIVTRGMDVGNHTTGHQNLRLPANATPEKIQSAVGGQAAFLENSLSDHPGYKVNTFALCFGQRPNNSFLQQYLATGASNGSVYRNIAILNVGSGPSYSPFDSRFTPLSLPRVRASEVPTGLYTRLRQYAAHPQTRFVSDGDPQTVTIPGELKKNLDEKRINGRTVRIAP